MTSTLLHRTSFADVECDVPAGQTLREWHRERELARRAQRPSRRAARVLRLRPHR